MQFVKSCPTFTLIPIKNDMEKSVPLKILIVDDDPDDLEYLKFIFDRNKDFEITACLEDGSAAVRHITESGNVPDVLLVDMYMPMMTGSEVVTKLSETAAAKNMNAFIISTTINRTEEENHRHNPNVKFLEKPTTLAHMNDLPGVILSHLNLPNANVI
ncbi:MAG: response regulator [Flavobacterium sp.]|nr:MAG: response regulator [Flavobacterium sp.]